MNNIRKSAIAGSWYPGKPSVLRQDIEKYFGAVPDSGIRGEIVALVAPHAGYMYSGQVAAFAYKLLCKKKYDSVIVIGPSHRVAFHGVSVFSRGGYETPLGVVPVDEEMAEAIRKADAGVIELPAAHLQEHSVEIQLPFLQTALGQFKFVPLVMGEQSESVCSNLAAAICLAAGEKKVLIVGSSDLSHFHSYKEAEKLDEIVLNHLRDCDAAGLMNSLNADTCEACGGGPMAVAMMAARRMGADKSHLLKYANSGDVTGDKNSVVGYAAAVFCK
ncbi:MAG TPA: AmmeMemoRadiSam system protein B [Smithellaceae bacterium]|nr:AmmeMemoRadiSam system protein B [Smithellaceae bacterium]